MRTVSQPPPIPVRSEVTGEPARLRWTLGELHTADGHRVDVVFACAVAIVDQPVERKLFEEVFGAEGRRSGGVTRAMVVVHFQASLAAAAAEFARNQTGEAMLAVSSRPELLSVLQTSANEVGFMCGLSILAPFDVQVTSPTLQKERLEQMQRIAAERRSADRVGHFARAAELLKQWESLKSQVPTITPGKLLEQIRPADRGLMLDTLLMAGGSEQRFGAQIDLWVASGSQLVQFDISGEQSAAKTHDLPGLLGPLRSIRSCGQQLLLGARSGALVMDRADLSRVDSYQYPLLNSEYGFTSVIWVNEVLCATHRQGGLVGWTEGRFGEPTFVQTIEALGGDPRNLTALQNGEAFFSVGNRLLGLKPDGSVHALLDMGAPIVAILAGTDQILAVGENGLITMLDRYTLEKTGELNRGGRVSGAALLPWLSSSRLVLNRADGPIECIGLEDQLVTQFSSGHLGLRSVITCGSKVAAMSGDRQRVIVWNSWDGKTVAEDVFVTGITRHRIADIAFA